MDAAGWSTQLLEAVGTQVRNYRKQLGMTAQDLADACAELGLEIPVKAVTNIETGRRASLGVGELLVLARALNVGPVGLVFPLGHRATVEAFPGREIPVWDAVAWFTEETPLEEPAPRGSARATIDAFRMHAQAAYTAITSLRICEERRRTPGTSVVHAEAMLADDVRALHEIRSRMSASGLVLPPWPEGLPQAD
ncbi:hypothetical protein GCM10023205_57210 [Yinghuangia aomiensis]|uniref:HTH cro/C1-type domain-containing protein n=1 Tax=Yinghuangia aomiensis TaxID=676205 RepID=A0ABP9HWK9_9ACTN